MKEEIYQTIRTTRISSFKYAIKILDPSPFISNYEKAVERFSREISALSKLQHRAIVNCIDAGLTIDNKPYIVMSYIDGIDLRTASSSMNDYQKATMILEVLHALEYTHENEIIHRDLKPSNIIVRTSDMQPVVLDFGCSFIFDELNETSLTTTAVGSIGYIPSEIIVNPKKRTALQDIYACGIIFYELFFRSKPDPHNYVPLASVNEKWNIFDPLIKKAISNENNRYQTAKEFYDDLIEVLDDI
jgi:serine/threonine-protein kinase